MVGGDGGIVGGDGGVSVQSVQSVPREHRLEDACGDPSSQTPLWLNTQALVHSGGAGEGGGGDGGDGGEGGGGEGCGVVGSGEEGDGGGDRSGGNGGGNGDGTLNMPTTAVGLEICVRL